MQNLVSVSIYYGSVLGSQEHFTFQNFAHKCKISGKSVKFTGKSVIFTEKKM